MKQITCLLALLASFYSVYARVDLVKANACEIKLDKEYKECFDYEHVTKENFESTCKAYQSDRCQKLYNEGVVVLQDCKILDLETRTYLNDKYGSKYVHLDFICSRDENNQSCPITKYYTEIEEDRSAREAFNQYINETCKSKRCTDAMITATNKEIEIRKGTSFESKTKFDSSKIDKPFDGASVADEDEVTYMVAFLKSSYCSSQHINSGTGSSYQTTGNANTNDATIIKFNSMLLFMFVILYIFI